MALADCGSSPNSITRGRPFLLSRPHTRIRRIGLNQAETVRTSSVRHGWHPSAPRAGVHRHHRTWDSVTGTGCRIDSAPRIARRGQRQVPGSQRAYDTVLFVRAPNACRNRVGLAWRTPIGTSRDLAALYHQVDTLPRLI